MSQCCRRCWMSERSRHCNCSNSLGAGPMPWSTPAPNPRIPITTARQTSSAERTRSTACSRRSEMPGAVSRLRTSVKALARRTVLRSSIADRNVPAMDACYSDCLLPEQLAVKVLPSVDMGVRLTTSSAFCAVIAARRRTSGWNSPQPCWTSRPHLGRPELVQA
jgi:hypothetical protein